MKLTSRLAIQVLAVMAMAVYVFFAFVAVASGDVKMRATLGMVSGLLLIWVVCGGSAMYLLRDRVKALIREAPGDWRLKFVVFCTMLALAEEAVTTLMTNLAPLFGVKMGEVYITASADYFDVVCHHSVIVFIPMFIVWAWLLGRYRISPGWTFVLFGLTGTLAESITFGLQNLLDAGFWAFVYGLMVWLPAYSVPAERKARDARWYVYPLAIVAPIFLSIPVIVYYVLLTFYNVLRLFYGRLRGIVR
jgi:hypothetical protein